MTTREQRLRELERRWRNITPAYVSVYDECADELAAILSDEVIVTDPHHDGLCQWKWDGELLWHKERNASKWTVVKRISFTKARILAIAESLKEPGQ